MSSRKCKGRSITTVVGQQDGQSGVEFHKWQQCAQKMAVSKKCRARSQKKNTADSSCLVEEEADDDGTVSVLVVVKVFERGAERRKFVRPKFGTSKKPVC